MKRIKKLVAGNGKYTVDGQEKTRWVNVGTVFQRDDGSTCIKLDSMPVGNEWNGWINVWDFDDEKRAPASAPAEDVPF